MTEAQERAIKWLRERGGSGVIDRYGRVMAAGELAKNTAPETWPRLVAIGELGGADNRVYLIRAMEAKNNG